MFSIIGSGFGLYGYLPSLIGSCGQRIILPERYRARFVQRPELARFSRDIHWETDESVALGLADGVVIAQRPVDQSAWIPTCIARTNIRRLVLEKPLANSPLAARDLLDALMQSRRTFRIGYLFRFTPWGQAFLQDSSVNADERIEIRWELFAHHFRYDILNWKRYHSEGGGAIRFYGIQLISLLAEAGYCDVLVSRASGVSEDEIDEWTAVFRGPRLASCEIRVSCRAPTAKFHVARFKLGDDSPVVLTRLLDPLQLSSDENASEASALDRRVLPLGRLCRSLWEPATVEYEMYAATLRLWRIIEANTEFEA